ncbi:hypothetical protein BJL90_20270 [Clostridium formicaceticum]|nr:hypothetical protein BJL90_20270 [Clostridium formicaceticum]
MTEVMEKGGEVIFTVTGNSMAPMLHHRRDKVCIVKPQEKPLKKYDVPLFLRKDGKYILHRIVAVKEEGYVVIGDNQWVKEYPVSFYQVMGVVKGFWREGKYISCDDFWYRVYCRLWVFGYPIRRIYLRAKQLCVKAERFLGDKKNEG